MLVPLPPVLVPPVLVLVPPVLVPPVLVLVPPVLVLVPPVLVLVPPVLVLVPPVLVLVPPVLVLVPPVLVLVPPVLVLVPPVLVLVPPVLVPPVLPPPLPPLAGPLHPPPQDDGQLPRHSAGAANDSPLGTISIRLETRIGMCDDSVREKLESLGLTQQALPQRSPSSRYGHLLRASGPYPAVSLLPNARPSYSMMRPTSTGRSQRNEPFFFHQLFGLSSLAHTVPLRENWRTSLPPQVSSANFCAALGPPEAEPAHDGQVRWLAADLHANVERPGVVLRAGVRTGLRGIWARLSYR